VEVPGGFEAVEILCKWLMVVVGRICLSRGDNCIVSDETGDIVDMTMGVVPGAASIEPDDLVDTEIVVESLLQLLTSHSRISLLDTAEKTFLRSKQHPSTVNIDTSAFEHDAMFSAVGERNRWFPFFQFQEFGSLAGDEIVLLPVGILRPRIEFPICNRNDGLFGITNEYRAGIPRPNAIGGPAMESYLLRMGAGAQKNAGGTFFAGFILH